MGSRRGAGGFEARAARAARYVAALLLASGGAACQLEEITLVDPENVVVAEVHVQVHQRTNERFVTAFLHRTLGSQGESAPVPGAAVTITRSDGLSLELAETDLERCVVTLPVTGTGTCHWAGPAAASRLGPGDTLAVRIDLPDGGVMESRTVVPGSFEILGVHEQCDLPADTPMTVTWTPSAGAWAYVNETTLRNVTRSFAARGVDVDPDDDPLYLLGLSISSADTTIVFPGEFGVFNRFELDQAVAVALQDGLPDGIWGPVSVTAADRNYVNWVRGGNFNPSGQVRIPSIQGNGTGVFAATVVEAFDVFTPSAPFQREAPACPTN